MPLAALHPGIGQVRKILADPDARLLCHRYPSACSGACPPTGAYLRSPDLSGFLPPPRLPSPLRAFALLPSLKSLFAAVSSLLPSASLVTRALRPPKRSPAFRRGVVISLPLVT